MQSAMCEIHGARILDDFADDRSAPYSAARLQETLSGRAEHPCAKVREGWVVCDECGDVARDIHLMPDAVDVSCVTAACSKHDPGGYALRLYEADGVKLRPWDWMEHLSGKGDGVAVLTLLAWLGRDGAAALDTPDRS